jgi:tRNA1Val (adenine37-N6)-methyltransferase
MFRFKQFTVDQSGCAMKINTDGVLLGALAQSDHPESILDIGTGTGVITLMLAQRFPDALIEGVEIDEAAAQTAQRNFTHSPFADKLTLHAASFEVFFEAHPHKKFDLIVTNPPFYINSLKSPGAARQMAKHTDKDFFERMVSAAAAHLTGNGTFWLILPPATASLVKVQARKHHLHLKHVVQILSYPVSVPHREILVFSSFAQEVTITDFVIYDSPKQYSTPYRIAFQHFFIIF